ncbi:hypothetical protein E4U41_000565 [Claviceps citrina]|nr:hypothetical protein E4U41_000565 [Claviceps citrina]
MKKRAASPETGLDLENQSQPAPAGVTEIPKAVLPADQQIMAQWLPLRAIGRPLRKQRTNPLKPKGSNGPMSMSAPIGITGVRTEQ